jgi:acyl carrier protein
MHAANELGRIATIAQQLLAEILDADTGELRFDADFVDELGVDSLEQLELIHTLESHLGLRLSSDAPRDARNLDQLARAVLDSSEGSSA